MKANLNPQNHPSRAAKGSRLVVVGNGMVGFRFLDALSKNELGKAYEITVFGGEPRPAYDRVHLTDFFSSKTAQALELASKDWYNERAIELLTNDPIAEIRPTEKCVISKSGTRRDYDHLVLATGSHPFVPPIKGADTPRVFVYRTIEDLIEIQNAAKQSRRAAVMGGGLLGLEAADALKKLGLETHIVERNIGLMSQQLPQEGSEILEQEIRSRGFHLHLNKNTQEIEHTENGKILKFQNGEALMVDMIVIASGIRPNDRIGTAAGLKRHHRGGLEIDDHLQTSTESIYAIGECANHRGVVYGLVGPGYKMAETLAARFAGDSVTFQGDFLAARLKLIGVDVATFGDHQGDGDTLQKQEKKSYRRIVIRYNRIVGATIVGDCDELNRIQEAVDSQRRVFQWNRSRFLRTGRLWKGGTELDLNAWPETALVCNCMNVRRGTLTEAILSSHCDTVEKLAGKTGASTVCGSCEPLLANLLGTASAPVPTKGYKTLGFAAILSALISLILITATPIADPVSVTQDSLSFLWTEGFWKFATGYTLVGLSVMSLLLSLRKRIKRIQWGNYGIWRAAHSLLGMSTLVILITHTGLRMGQNLNFILMLNFIALAIAGAMAGFFTSLESRLSEPWARRIRATGTLVHIVLFWPLPVLIFFHAFKAYYY